LRQDKSYIGTEDIKLRATENKPLLEVGIFLVFGIGSIIFLVTHEKFLKRYFEASRLDLASGICIILILSPFGAHLIAKILTFFWERLNEISKITRTKRGD
jgi:hypothetical protein